MLSETLILLSYWWVGDSLLCVSSPSLFLRNPWDNESTSAHSHVCSHFFHDAHHNQEADNNPSWGDGRSSVAVSGEARIISSRDRWLVQVTSDLSPLIILSFFIGIVVGIILTLVAIAVVMVVGVIFLRKRWVSLIYSSNYFIIMAFDLFEEHNS